METVSIWTTLAMIGFSAVYFSYFPLKLWKSDRYQKQLNHIKQEKEKLKRLQDIVKQQHEVNVKRFQLLQRAFGDVRELVEMIKEMADAVDTSSVESLEESNSKEEEDFNVLKTITDEFFHYRFLESVEFGVKEGVTIPQTRINLDVVRDYYLTEPKLRVLKAINKAKTEQEREDYIRIFNATRYVKQDEI